MTTFSVGHQGSYNNWIGGQYRLQVAIPQRAVFWVLLLLGATNLDFVDLPSGQGNLIGHLKTEKFRSHETVDEGLQVYGWI